jgi:hypothetical protein
MHSATKSLVCSTDISNHRIRKAMINKMSELHIFFTLTVSPPLSLSLCIYLHIYVPIYLLTYKPTYLPTYLFVCLSIYLPIYI